MLYSIEIIAQRISAERIGTAPGSVKWLLTDSRSLGFPEETLFFALVTARGDGHRYIGDLTACVVPLLEQVALGAHIY